MATNIHEPYIISAMTSTGTLDANSVRSSTLERFGRTSCSGMSAGSEDTADSGFYQLNPDNLTPEFRSPSPRPSPRAIRRLSNMTESTDAEDIVSRQSFRDDETISNKLELLHHEICCVSP